MGVDVVLLVDAGEVDISSLPYTAEIEIRLLHQIFPEEYWRKGTGEFFNFEVQNARVKSLVRQFQEDVNSETELPALTGYSPADRREYAIEWLSDFLRFYAYGLDLQKQGKRPHIRIS